MEPTTLQYLRYTTPGVIFILFWTIFLAVPRGTFGGFDLSFETLQSSIPVLITGLFYYVFPLRSWANKRFYNRVNENLRSKLVDIAGVEDNEKKLSWKRVKNSFYDLIDNDATLTTRSQRVMFNGFIWTTIADVRVFSLIFFILSAILWFSDIERSHYLLILFFLVGLISLPLSEFVTQKHIRLGDDQIEFIRGKYQTKVTAELRQLLNE